jgi:UDP-N-acetylmuramoyl-L-alanyl-D-glutamate--2,6-diaminopimelate ligase
VSTVGDLLREWPVADSLAGVSVRRVDLDSRQCEPGSLFFALKGHIDDGAKYIADARRRGAVAVVASEILDDGPTVVVAAADLPRALAKAAARIVEHPERAMSLAGVTGTNGKTTVTTLLSDLWRQLGHDAAVIGTVTHQRTTPAGPELFRVLRGYLDEWAPTPDAPMVALEVSSHALDQGRVDGLLFDVAIFTNLSHDHLDYHGTMERYFAAKAQLFTPNVARQAVIWVGDEWGHRLADECPIPHVDVDPEDVVVERLALGGTVFVWRNHLVRTGLTGAINVTNTVLALEAGLALGASAEDLVAAAAHLTSAPGRLEVVAQEGPTVLVDYAHTPDGLARVLDDVRRVSDGRVVLVFGCGGDRDREKRPVMGDIASRLADEVFVTSDNPRSEDPSAILSAIRSGRTGHAIWHEVLDRHDAIRAALEVAGAGDVVIVAGKGHEKTQEIAGRVVEFDDAAVVRELTR